MRSHESLLTLIAELDGDEREIARVLAHNSRAWERIAAGADDPLDWGALGYTIHTLYGVAENYFLRISKYFENGLPSDVWHKALVEKMALDIPQLRPPFFADKAKFKAALELLKFRYRFRNLYGEDLDPIKTRAVQEVARCFFTSFPEMHGSFRGKLTAICRGVEVMFDPVPYADELRKLNELEHRQITDKVLLANVEAGRLAAAIKTADPQVRSVYLFGSLAEGEPKRLDFDIDLALDGGDVYLAMELASDSAFKVDLVDLRRLPPHIRARIEQKGKKY